MNHNYSIANLNTIAAMKEQECYNYKRRGCRNKP